MSFGGSPENEVLKNNQLQFNLNIPTSSNNLVTNFDQNRSPVIVQKLSAIYDSSDQLVASKDENMRTLSNDFMQRATNIARLEIQRQKEARKWNDFLQCVNVNKNCVVKDTLHQSDNAGKCDQETNTSPVTKIFANKKCKSNQRSSMNEQSCISMYRRELENRLELLINSLMTAKSERINIEDECEKKKKENQIYDFCIHFNRKLYSLLRQVDLINLRLCANGEMEQKKKGIKLLNSAFRSSCRMLQEINVTVEVVADKVSPQRHRVLHLNKQFVNILMKMQEFSSTMTGIRYSDDLDSQLNSYIEVLNVLDRETNLILPKHGETFRSLSSNNVIQKNKKPASLLQMRLRHFQNAQPRNEIKKGNVKLPSFLNSSRKSKMATSPKKSVRMQDKVDSTRQTINVDRQYDRSILESQIRQAMIDSRKDILSMIEHTIDSKVKNISEDIKKLAVSQGKNIGTDEFNEQNSSDKIHVKQEADKRKDDPQVDVTLDVMTRHKQLREMCARLTQLQQEEDEIRRKQKHVHYYDSFETSAPVCELLETDLDFPAPVELCKSTRIVGNNHKENGLVAKSKSELFSCGGNDVKFDDCRTLLNLSDTQLESIRRNRERYNLHMLQDHKKCGQTDCYSVINRQTCDLLRTVICGFLQCFSRPILNGAHAGWYWVHQDFYGLLNIMEK